MKISDASTIIIETLVADGVPLVYSVGAVLGLLEGILTEGLSEEQADGLAKNLLWFLGDPGFSDHVNSQMVESNDALQTFH